MKITFLRSIFIIFTKKTTPIFLFWVEKPTPYFQHIPIYHYSQVSGVLHGVLQWGSAIQVSIERPVATRHRRDMTEKLLKATLNPNKQQQQQQMNHAMRKPVYAICDNKGADQPGHPRSLISAFVVRCLYNTFTYYSLNFKTLATLCLISVPTW